MKTLEHGRRILLARDGLSASDRLLRHLMAGGAGTLLYIVAVASLVELGGVDPVTAVVIGFSGIVAITYVVNRVWVYHARNRHRHALPKFLTVTAIGLILNAAIMYLAVDVATLWYGWGLAVAALVVPATNFLLNYLWAFR